MLMISGSLFVQVVQQFGIPYLFELPIRPEVSSFY